ncbi:Ankyrin repeat, SAM and basic leucine zipper domain-containing protein 1 [Colletotrichum fructicola]|nr:Ankyrin repeat, SAM and basic leucine zipper domain-containing protein 1 [Colletotrichum fructicola]
MAEILGIAAATIQLTELTIKILSEGYAFLNKTVGAPTEIRQLLTETAALDCLLSRLRDLSHPANPALVHENALLRLKDIGVFDECNHLLNSINQTLTSLRREDGERVRNIAKRLAWSLRAQKEVQESLDRLRRMKETLSTALETNTALAVDRIEETVNQADWQRVFSWVCPVAHLQTQHALQDLLSRRHPGSGLWLIESEAFGNWVNDQSGELLWITGLPGAGKSALCATAVEALSSRVHLPGAIMVYFFCSFEESEKAALHFLMSIAAQFISRSQRCFDIASKRQKDKNGFSLTIGEYITLVESFMNEYHQVFIVVDDLDEVGGMEMNDKEAFVAVLSRFMRMQAETTISSNRPAASGPQIGRGRKVLLTSREDAYIRTQLANECKCLLWKLDSQQGNRLHADLSHFVWAELQERLRSRRIRVGNPALVSTIRDHILRTAGTFLQANLQLDYITATRTDRELRQTLQSLPNGLNATYERILVSALQKYPQRKSEMKQVLQWLAIGLMPLSGKTLAEVTSIDQNDTALDFDAIVTDPYDVVAPLVQLVSYYQTSRYRSDAATIVQIHHATVKEFLTGSDILATSASIFYFSEVDAHAFAAERCLQYRAFSDFDRDVPEDPRDFEAFLSKYSFLYYAAMNWATHMRLCSLMPGISDIHRFQRHLYWFLNPAESPKRYQLWQAVLRTSPGLAAARHSAAPIIYAIANDLHVLVEALLPTLDDLNEYFPDGSTCLLVAAIVNNVKLARHLLSRGAGVDVPDKMRQLTPLHVAAEHGSEEMVELLLEHGASPYARSDSGTTPFYRAARDGSTKILKLLRAAGSELDAKTWDLWTPLMEAVENGHREAVRLLLSWGADARNISKFGTTPLELASNDLAHLITEAGGGPGVDRSDELQEEIESRGGNIDAWRPARIG